MKLIAVTAAVMLLVFAVPAMPVSSMYEPRAQDFVKVFKAVETLTFAGWEVSTGKVIDLNDQDSASSNSANERLMLLKEFHCNECLSKIYSGQQSKIILDLYRFDDPAGAYGAYTCLREGASTVVRRGDGSSEDDDGISFWQDNYLILLRATGTGSDAGKNIMRKVADKIAQNIEKHSYTPVILSELPFMDRVSGSEHVFMGPLAARKFSPVHINNDLVLKGCVIGATADYQISEPFMERLKIMLINYKDAAAAIAAGQRLIGDICPSCGVLQPESPMVVKLAGKYAWCKVRGAKLAIVSNGRRATSVTMLGHELNW